MREQHEYRDLRLTRDSIFPDDRLGVIRRHGCFAVSRFAVTSVIVKYSTFREYEWTAQSLVP